MKNGMKLSELLPDRGESKRQRANLFALLSLGIIESLSNGLLSAHEALRSFFHADNCLFVRKVLRIKAADEVMGRGVQLADLFELLPPDDAQREFQKELSIMRGLCLRLLEKKLQVA